ncbi:16S rRNA (adenine(1518)-N(6)/adenine(1519)-N(6))-dimethyltransferase RsmA [Solemya velum gill symbiont]|uniref:16S rRNA (adenine(1518)-N(6)/adenine(1519)-N(6))- dimethyltransferase RsmA n=2 Tax=Solemya velum gill symbiont TaxID=2340 RepID=UPI00351DA57B
MKATMAHTPRKRFGQNFLHDQGVIQRIVTAVNPQADQHLVEIGPGEAAITRLLVKECRHLDVIEIDRDLAPLVADTCGNPDNLTVHNADALKFDFCSLATSGKLRVVGNLPYNISTPLLFHLLEQADCVADLHVMLQKEVVERIAAPHGNKSYGRLSVAIQARCRVQPLFTIGPGAFRPPPKIDSAVVRLVPDADKIAAIKDPVLFNRVLVSAFSMRRKTLRNALKKVADTTTLESCGIDPSLRAEQIPVEAFVSLANCLATKTNTDTTENE